MSDSVADGNLCTADYGRCGGKYVNATCCLLGAFCHRWSNLYSQCLPLDSPKRTAAALTNTTLRLVRGLNMNITARVLNCSAVSALCGGPGWTGPTCCASGETQTIMCYQLLSGAMTTLYCVHSSTGSLCTPQAGRFSRCVAANCTPVWNQCAGDRALIRILCCQVPLGHRAKQRS